MDTARKVVLAYALIWLAVGVGGVLGVGEQRGEKSSFNGSPSASDLSAPIFHLTRRYMKRLPTNKTGQPSLII